MGNAQFKPTPKYNHTFWTLQPNEMNDLRRDYDIVNVDRSIDTVHVANLLRDNTKLSQHKVNVVLNMAAYFVSHTDSTIYTEKTNYLCNREEKICICNTTATDYRRFADGINFTDNIFVAWVKKS